MPTETDLASNFSRDSSRLQQARTLMRSLTAQTHEIFSRGHEEMLTRLRKHLFELADKSESPARATHWMSAYMLLDRQAEPFKRAHLAALRLVLDEVCDAAIKAQQTGHANKNKNAGFSGRTMSSSLSLVDMSEMDRTVLVDRVARPMNTAFDETLAPFTQRIGLLLGYEEPELSHNPYRPESFIRALALGWENAKLDPHATEDLILALSPNSFFALGDLFDTLNITLMKAGVAPQLKYRVKRARDVSAVGASTLGGGSPTTSTQNGAESRSPGNTQEFARSSSPAAAALQGDAQAGPGFGDSILRIGLSAKDFLIKLSTRLQRPLFGQAAQDGGGEVFPPTQPDPEFFGFLSDVQRSIDESPQTDNDVRNILRQIREQDEVRRAPELDRGTVDALSEVFDYVFNDESIPSQLKVIIGRLQIPVLKAAMLDREFFFKEDHPARKLVDALATASVEWAPEKGDGDPLYIRIESTVQRVLTEFQEDLELFTELLLDFESFLFEHEQQVSARIEPQAFDAERNEKLDLGLRAADEVIHAKLEGRTLEPLLPPFLTTQWREVMARAWLARDERPDLLERAEETMDQLIWSTEPKTTAEDRRALVTTLPGMVRNLNVALDAIRWNGAPRAEFTKRLIETHTRVVRAGAAQPQDPERKELEAQAAHQAIVELDHRRTAQLAGSEDEFDVMAHAITRGLWLEFLTEDGSMRRYRLGWISPMRTRLLFTNREGFDAFVCSEREVAAWLRSGRLRVLETEAIVGRALGSILQQGEDPA